MDEPKPQASLGLAMALSLYLAMAMALYEAALLINKKVCGDESAEVPTTTTGTRARPWPRRAGSSARTRIAHVQEHALTMASRRENHSIHR